MAARSSTSTTTTNNTTTSQSNYSPYPNYNTTPNPHHNNAYYQNYYYNDQQYQPPYNDPNYQNNYQNNYNPATVQSPRALTAPPFPLNTKSSFTSSTCSKKSPTLATKVKKFFSALGTPPTRDHDELARNAGAIVLGSEILGTAYHEATHGKLQDVRGDGGCRKVD